MALAAFPFETQDTSETEYSFIFRELQDPGVIGVPGDTTLKVIPGTGLQVKVQAGRAFARGFMLSSTADEPLPIAAPSAAQRVDRIVVRVDPAANDVTLEVKPGTSGSTAPPALTQTDTGVFEFPLARVTVPAGASAITAGNIVDERPRVSARLGLWTTATRPSPVSPPALGFNFTTNGFEYNLGAGWKDLAPSWSTLTGKPTTSTLDGRTIYSGDSAPASSLGVNGDIYLEW